VVPVTRLSVMLPQSRRAYLRPFRIRRTETAFYASNVMALRGGCGTRRRTAPREEVTEMEIQNAGSRARAKFISRRWRPRSRIRRRIAPPPFKKIAASRFWRRAGNGEEPKRQSVDNLSRLPFPVLRNNIKKTIFAYQHKMRIGVRINPQLLEQRRTFYFRHSRIGNC